MTSSFGAAVPRANVRPFERDAVRRRIARQEARRDCAARRPARRARFGERHGAIHRRRDRRHVEHELRVGERRDVLPLGALAVGDERDLPRVEPRRAHDGRGARERERGIAGAAIRLRCGRSRRAASATLPPRTLPSIVTSHTRSADVRADSTSRAIDLNWSSSGCPLTTTDELSELSTTIGDAPWVRDRRRPIAPPAAPRRRRSRAARARAATSIRDSRIRSVRLCSFSARSEVARRGKVDARADAAPHQMDEERHGDRGAEQRGTAARESSRQLLARRERAAQRNAEGSVGGDDLVARCPSAPNIVRHSPITSSTVLRYAARTSATLAGTGELALRIDEQRLARSTGARARPGSMMWSTVDVVTRGAQRAHRALDVGQVHEQIGNQDDESATVDQPGGLLERVGRARRLARLPAPRARRRRGATGRCGRGAGSALRMRSSKRTRPTASRCRSSSSASAAVSRSAYASFVSRSAARRADAHLRAAPGHGAADVEHDRWREGWFLPRTGARPTGRSARRSSSRCSGGRRRAGTGGSRRTRRRSPCAGERWRPDMKPSTIQRAIISMRPSAARLAGSKRSARRALVLSMGGGKGKPGGRAVASGPQRPSNSWRRCNRGREGRPGRRGRKSSGNWVLRDRPCVCLIVYTSLSRESRMMSRRRVVASITCAAMAGSACVASSGASSSSWFNQDQAAASAPSGGIESSPTITRAGGSANQDGGPARLDLRARSRTPAARICVRANFHLDDDAYVLVGHIDADGVLRIAFPETPLDNGFAHGHASYQSAQFLGGFVGQYRARFARRTAPPRRHGTE